MKKSILLLSLVTLLSQISFAQNVGIGNTNPQAKLDVNGDLILRSYTLTVADGTSYGLDVNTNKFSNYKLTGTTSNFQIAGITAAANDRNITLYNRTGNSMEIYNDDATAAVANRIITGTGTTFAVYNGGTVSLRYDATIQKWEVISSHYNNLDYFGGGGGIGSWDINGSDISNNNTGKVGIGITNPTAKLTINGNLALLSDTVKVACDIMPTKMLIDNIAKPKSVLHIINDGCITFMPPTVVGLSGGTDGKMVTIITHLNYTQLQHLQGTTPIPTASDSLNMIELYEPNSNGNINQPFSYSFNAGGSVTLIYDGTRNRWKLLSYNGDIKSETFGWYKGSNVNDIYNPNAGNVGIGTGSPTEKFDVNGNLKVRKNLLITDTLAIGTTAPTQKLDVAGNAKVRNNFFVDGNVGIGTTTPTNQLQVVDANTYGGFIKIGANSSAPGWNKKLLFGDGNFVSVGESLIDDQMELTAGNFYFKNNSGTGNVGIGISSPNASLSVARGNGTDGTAAFFGTTNTSHFNYSSNEDTYIRGGKNSSKLLLNDYGGQVALGTATTGNAQLNIVSSRTGGNANGLSINQGTTNTGNDSYGLYSYSTGSNLTNRGLKGETGGTGTVNMGGDFRAATVSAGKNWGIQSWAEGSQTENYGGKFDAFGGISSTVNQAVHAFSTGTGDSYGIYAEAQSSNNLSNAYGIYAKATGGNGIAGYFVGNVAVLGSLSKSSGSFLIDHPQDPANKYLYHSFVESPDMMNIYNGNIVTGTNSEAVVELPGYFNALNKDYRYQLTVIGQPAQVWVHEEIKNNRFVIKSDKPNVKISWQVTGIRQDAWANEHRIIPEVEKEAKNKGKYLTPEVFKQPKEKAINYVKPLEDERQNKSNQ